MCLAITKQTIEMKRSVYTDDMNFKNYCIHWFLLFQDDK